MSSSMYSSMRKVGYEGVRQGIDEYKEGFVGYRARKRKGALDIERFS